MLSDLGDLGDFDRVMVVGPIISETTDLLELSHTAISRVYREWSERENLPSEQQFCGRNCLGYVGGEWLDCLNNR